LLVDGLDHTSLIRVIEKRFGVREPNISAFRRRGCGDFTTALRFSGPARRRGLISAAWSARPGQRGLISGP
jgi:phospholipase C